MADLGFQYLRNGGHALRLLPGRPHITPRYPRLVGRWLFYLGGLRAFASHNPWLGVPNTVTSQGCRAVTEQGTYRLTHKMEKTRAKMKTQALAQIPETKHAGGPVVRLSDVVKVYKVSAIKGITFDIPRQRFSMIVGPSGSGKTTLLNLIR